MGSSIRIELHSGNIKKFLRSQEVADLVRRPAEKIKAAADAGSGDDGHTVRVVQGHKDRVIALVSANSYKAAYAERDNRNLTRSLDAGRG